MDETKEATFKEIKYSLKLNCTYREFVDWIQQEQPTFMISTVDNNTFDLYLPSEDFIEQAGRIFPKMERKRATTLLLSSFMRLEILSDNPLTLEGTHYYLVENSPEIQKFSKLIAWAKRIFGQVEKQQGSAAKPENEIEDTTGWDKLLIEMWNKNYERDEIASRVHKSPDRVTNRITELRNKYGPEIVPYNKERKKRIVRKS